MKNNYLTMPSCVFAFLLVFSIPFLGISQSYCLPIVDVTNGGGMGITNFTCGTINHNSIATEGFIINNDTAMFETGTTASFSISSVVGTFCPNQDIRIYVDWNGDLDFNDNDEEVVTLSNEITGVFTGTFAIPQTTALGVTKMRVMNKMIVACGHTLIEPCGTDSFVYHGEIEDYFLYIDAPTALQQDISKPTVQVAWNANQSTMRISIENTVSADGILQILDLNGKVLYKDQNLELVKGKQDIRLSGNDFKFTSNGIYLLKLNLGQYEYVKKMILH